MVSEHFLVLVAFHGRKRARGRGGEVQPGLAAGASSRAPGAIDYTGKGTWPATCRPDNSRKALRRDIPLAARAQTRREGRIREFVQRKTGEREKVHLGANAGFGYFSRESQHLLALCSHPGRLQRRQSPRSTAPRPLSTDDSTLHLNTLKNHCPREAGSGWYQSCLRPPVDREVGGKAKSNANCSWTSRKG